MHTMVMEPGYLGIEPGFLYRFNRQLYETITSSHLELHTKPGRIKGYKLYGVTRQVETTGTNLFGGKALADKVMEVVPNATVDTANGTVTYAANEIEDKVLYTGFEAGKQYTIILYGKNTNPDVNASNLMLKYTDGSHSSALRFQDNTESYCIYATDASKTPEELKGYWDSQTTILYYDKCGIFEGEIGLEAFEPYTGSSPSPTPEYPQEIQGVGTLQKDGTYLTTVVLHNDTQRTEANIYTHSPIYDGDKIELVDGQYCHVRWKNNIPINPDKIVYSINNNSSYASIAVIHNANDTPYDTKYTKLLCSHFKYYFQDGNYKYRTIPNVFMGYEDGSAICIITIAVSDFPDENAFIAFLQTQEAAGTPVTLQYEMTAPIIEPIPSISQEAIRNLKTYKGTTIIDTTDPLEPEITVSYRPQADYSKIPGLEVDYENSIYTRLGGAKNLTAGAQFNRFPMYAGRRRCNVSDDGTITAYVGDPNYGEDGSNGQVMVYQPKFWYQVIPLKIEPQKDGLGYHLRRAQYWVSHKPMPGFKLHPAFLKPHELEYIMYAAFEGSIYDSSAAAYILDDAQVMDTATDKFSSISGAKPASGKTQLLTRTNVEKLAQNRGPGWHGDTIDAESANQLLMMIELGTPNTQAAIAQGVVSIPDTPNTDNNSIITGGTSSLGNNTGMADGANGKASVTYRGMENPWGNMWKFVHGVNIWGNGSMKGGVPYICTDYSFEESKNTGNYESSGFTIANANGYISAMGYSYECDWLFMPSETLGSNSVPVGDYTYTTANLNGYRIARLGGAWDGSGLAGGFYLALNDGVGFRARSIGGRLIYVPQ